MIEFKNVSYTYPDGVSAIDDISLTITSGEKVAVVGNNGSGKTTLALLVNGILKPAEGSISVNGYNPISDSDRKALKRIVSLVFQNPDNQLVATTVEREVAFSLENQNVGHPEIKERVDDALEYFGLFAYRHRLTSELSGGEKQKLALASVMVARPEILILDEPGSYLDESGKRLLDAAIRKLLDRVDDLTIIRITQFSHVTLDYKRLIVLKDGKALRDSNPDEIFSDADLCQQAGISIPLRYRIRPSAMNLEKDDYSNGEQTEIIKSISLTNISFSYDDTDIFSLKNINLNVKNTGLYGIVGPSGSGKSTLIQLMAGLLSPKEGGINHTGFEPKSGTLAVSFQHPERQFFLDTVDKEIRFGAENLHLPSVDEIADNCYNLIGLSKVKFSARDPFTLSGGEKRRLAFGTILSLVPSFIFFDEPTCGLDYEGIELFKKMAKNLRRMGVGIVIVSHYGNIIFELADEIIALNDGQVECAVGKKEFFTSKNYFQYLSQPEAVSYQLEHFGTVKYFSEGDLIHNIKFNSRL